MLFFSLLLPFEPLASLSFYKYSSARATSPKPHRHFLPPCCTPSKGRRLLHLNGVDVRNDRTRHRTALAYDPDSDTNACAKHEINNRDAR
jgi:hypothetical protein